MLTIVVPGGELYDEDKNEFITSDKPHALQLEHSLVSLSKWESKWHKPFLSKGDKPFEESADYIRCMTITQNVDPEVYKFVSQENIHQVNEYIDAKMTATIIKDRRKATNNKVITAEIIYYWMISFQIPFECQKWHLNRLLTLIDVCSIENDKSSDKMSKEETAKSYAEINRQRREALNSKG